MQELIKSIFIKIIKAILRLPKTLPFYKYFFYGVPKPDALGAYSLDNAKPSISFDEHLKKERRFIFSAIVLLTLFGTLMVYESSSMYAYKISGDPLYFFMRQIIYFIAGLALFFITLFADIDFLRRNNKMMFIATIVLLAIVVVIGRAAGGAKRWLHLGGFNLQPSEILKISFVFYAINYFCQKGHLIRDFRQGLLPIGVVLSFTCFLLLLQPDLGTAVFWIAWTMIFFFIYRARARHILPVIGLSLLALFFLIKFSPYRFRRMVSYMNPFADPQGAGFQLVQSQIAFGNGSLFGVGLGEGRQKLFFLPAAHTDFIFSIIAEELGFLGSFSVLLLCFIIFQKMFNIAKNTHDEFRRGVLLGIIFIFFLEILGNIGVSCGIFPTKGLPFPFLSYGGSSLIVHYILLGLFFNVSRNCVNKTDKVFVYEEAGS